jgi:hypothetical protein
MFIKIHRLAGLFCVLSLLFGLLLADAFGEPVSSDNDAKTAIPLKLKTGVVTEAEFPEKIAGVTKSVSAEFLEVETLGNRMFLLPLKSFDSYVHVVTEDNISYCLHLIMGEAEASTYIKMKKQNEAKPRTKGWGAYDTIEIMRTLLKGEEPFGASSVNSHDKEIFNNGVFRILTEAVYELGGGARALRLRLENLMDKPIVLPIENIELPGLVAISVDAQVLGARPRRPLQGDSDHTTKAYLIVQSMESIRKDYP